MKEEQFDDLWMRAEAGRYARSLMAEYPGWRRRQRRRVAAAAALVVLAGAALPLLNGVLPLGGADGEYLAAHCNKAGIGEDYWVDLAGDLLAESLEV